MKSRPMKISGCYCVGRPHKPLEQECPLTRATTVNLNRKDKVLQLNLKSSASVPSQKNQPIGICPNGGEASGWLVRSSTGICWRHACGIVVIPFTIPSLLPPENS